MDSTVLLAEVSTDVLRKVQTKSELQHVTGKINTCANKKLYKAEERLNLTWNQQHKHLFLCK